MAWEEQVTMVELTQRPEPVLELQQRLKDILVVDDEGIIRDLCSKALKGYNVVEAADGEEALRLFESSRFDVILTDVMMPKMDGIELLKRLKEQEPTLVVIIMTGFADKDIKMCIRDSGILWPLPISLISGRFPWIRIT